MIQMKAINPKFSEFLNLHTVIVTLEEMKLKSYWVFYQLTKLVLICKSPSENLKNAIKERKTYRWFDLLGK